MRWIRDKAVTTLAAAVVLAGVVTVLLAACGHASAPSHARQLRSPFTGEPVPWPNRVLAVRIDNIVNARPWTGLTRADIVFVLPVEGGLSRFPAIFSSNYPRVIGPVRSGREDDLICCASSADLPSPTRARRRRCSRASTGPPGSWTSTTASPAGTSGTITASLPTTCTPTHGSCCGKLTARAWPMTSGAASARRRAARPPSRRRVLPGGLVRFTCRLSGKGCSRGLVQRSWQPACARVLAGQLAYLQLRNRRAIHGKEKFNCSTIRPRRPPAATRWCAAATSSSGSVAATRGVSRRASASAASSASCGPSVRIQTSRSSCGANWGKIVKRRARRAVTASGPLTLRSHRAVQVLASPGGGRDRTASHRPGHSNASRASSRYAAFPR